MRTFETKTGLSFNVKQDKCCVFCFHCSDIFYDTSGPYMIFCTKENKCADTHNIDGLCEQFIEKP